MQFGRRVRPTGAVQMVCSADGTQQQVRGAACENAKLGWGGGASMNKKAALAAHGGSAQQKEGLANAGPLAAAGSAPCRCRLRACWFLGHWQKPQPVRCTLTVLVAVTAARLAPYDCQVAPILPIWR